MRRHLYIGIIGILLLSGCDKEYVPREAIQANFQKFTQDSTSIRAIAVLNDSTMIYAGSNGSIVSLTSNGETNTIHQCKVDSIKPHFRSIAVIKDHFYALSIGSPALLYKGNSSEIDLVYQENHEKVFYDAMQFFDDSNGIAMGDPTDNCLSIILTADGGNTWNKVDCNVLPEIFEGEAAFAASNTNIAIVGKNAWIATGGIHARVFHTTDMGTTWDVYNTPIIQGKNTTGIYSIDFYDEKNGIICGGDYTDKFGKSANKAITKDGGKTWQVVGNEKEPFYISCVQYIPNTQGKEVMAVSTNGVFYSNNGGYNFSKISDQGYYAMQFIDRNSAWFSGNEVVSLMKIDN